MSLTSVGSLFSQMQKDHGGNIGGFDLKQPDLERIPSGLFPLDLALGGGIPRGKMTLIYGPESSGKSNLVFSLIREHQRLFPDLRCVFFDVEHAFQRDWAERLGVDCEKLLVIRPNYVEQVVDMVEGLLLAEDCGMVAIDSLAMMQTMNEMDSSAEKAMVGTGGLACNKLVKKTTRALMEAEKNGFFPTLIYVNQIRFKVGVMYGDPETLPGGKGQLFQAALRMRLYGKDEKAKGGSDKMPSLKTTSVVLKKWKCPVVATHAEWSMVTVPFDYYKVGDCADWNTVSAFLRQFGWLYKHEKQGHGWMFKEENFKTLEAVRQSIYSDREKEMSIKTEIIKQALTETTLSETGGSNA